jgi:hypothetical protein
LGLEAWGSGFRIPDSGLRTSSLKPQAPSPNVFANCIYTHSNADEFSCQAKKSTLNTVKNTIKPVKNLTIGEKCIIIISEYIDIYIKDVHPRRAQANTPGYPKRA